MKTKPSPCINCPKKGCGAYHDVCPKYQEYAHEEVSEKNLYRYYINQTTWNNRKRQKKRGN